MKKTYTIKNFAKRLVMVLAVGLMAFNVWGADPNTTFSFTSSTASTALDVTAPASTRSGTSIDGKSVTQSPITISFSAGTGNDPLFWQTTTSGTYQVRMYNGNSVTISAASGYTIKAITASGSNVGGTTYWNSADGVLNGGVSDASLTTKTFRCIKSTVQINSITVTYVADCDKSVTISKGTATNCSFELGKTGAQASCSGVSTTVTVNPNTGYGNPSVTQSGASAAPSITGSGNNWTVSYGNNTTGTSTINVSCSANNYIVTLNDNTGSGGSGSKTVTYNANTNLTTIVTVPTKAHHDFAGYWTSTDNGATFGTKLVNADGSWVASVTNYTDASKNWIKADNVTLYAKWTEHGLTNYRTSCCTELDMIDGEATLTQGGNSVTISGWSDVSNVGTYTVKLYKKNGASWDLVSGTTSGGSAGAQGTRTGITSGSKSVTYTGLEVESEYKFTVQAIAGSAAYCDGVETAVTEINSKDVSSTPFKFRYAIYIDDGTNDNYEYYYIEPTGNTDEGSVDIDLSAHVDYYQFKIAGGFSGWWGQTYDGKIEASTVSDWTLDGSNNVKLKSGAGGTYTFTVDYSGTTNPKVGIEYPSADQDAGYEIYYDNSVLNWSNLYYRIGNNSKCSKVDVSLVPGTDKFYKVTTPDFDNMDAWHIANNYGWTGSNSIYRTKTSSDPAESPKAITNSIAFQQYAVTEDITVIPTSTHSTGSDTGDAGNSNCEFYTINTPTSGMLTHNAAITSYSHGTVTVTYTNTSGSAASFTSGNADLAHRCKLTITATPATGYSLSSLQVNSSNFTSGNEHILAADATITAVFTAQTSTVTLQATSATTGSDQTVLATYDASMPLVTTADKTPAVAAISRTGYTFNGWWDATSSGKQYYSHSAGTIASANNWDKTGSQTLYAQWIAKEYTITLDREGGSTGAESATATFDSGTLTGWSAPTKTGYTFGGYYSGDNGTGTLVISTSGVLQNSVTINAVNWTDASGHWIKEGGATVYAKWTANEYTISYKDQGDVAYSGSNSALLPTTHTYGAATDLVDGVKSGYRFDGWFDNSTCTGSAITSIGATAITANTTYYAKWTEVYTVTWHVNGEEYSTGVVTGNSQVPDGEKISDVPTAPADNTLNNCANKFMGWSAKDAGSTAKTTSYYDDLFTDVEGSSTISDDIDFYAVFAEETATRDEGYYVKQAGVALTVGKTYVFGSVKASANESLADNTTFGAVAFTNTYNSTSPNWGPRVDLTPNTSGYIAADNASLTDACKWTLISISSGNHTFKNGDNYLYLGSLLGSTTNGAQSGVSTSSGNCYLNSVHATCKDAYILYNTSAYTDKMMMYNTSYGYRMYVYTQTKSESMTPYVRFYEYDPGYTYSNYVTQCAANQVRVTYDFNGGTGTACTEGVTTKSASYTVCSTEPVKDYYDFAGWNDGTNTYDAGDPYNLQATTEFTATWTPTEYSITYYLNGGTQQVTPAAPTSYTVESSAVTLPTPTKNHDRFDGWYGNVDLSTGGVQTSIAAGSNGNKEYWAKWTARNEIKFYADDNLLSTIYRATDENLQASVAGQGSKPDDPSAPSACSSKVFMGWTETWFNDETDTEPADLNDATGTRTGAKTYYAVWATRAGSPGSYTYSAYSTTCCGKSVEVDGGSPSNGTVTFDKSYAWTCKGDREIVMTIDPADGYQLHTFSVATGDGKVAAKSMSADVALDNNSSAAQVITLTFAKDADGDYDVTATFTEMTATSWTWTKNVGGAEVTTDPIDIYVGQKVQVDVAYSPSGLLSSHTDNKAYIYDPSPWSNSNVGSPAVAGAYFTVTGTNAGSTSVVLNHKDGLTKTIYYNILALPLVHFKDLIHGETFADVTASISGDKYTVTMTGKTPTHDDLDEPGTGNSCEKTHLHLIGWIRSDYSKVADYMNGTGEAPSVSDLTTAGAEYWFLPDADINVETYNGKTFYAVWAIEE